MSCLQLGDVLGTAFTFNDNRLDHRFRFCSGKNHLFKYIQYYSLCFLIFEGGVFLGLSRVVLFLPSICRIFSLKTHVFENVSLILNIEIIYMVIHCVPIPCNAGDYHAGRVYYKSTIYTCIKFSQNFHLARN